MNPTKTEAIKRFLTAFTHADLAALYERSMEVQVHVTQDGGTLVGGEYEGRTWRAWQDDAGNTWKSFRIPLDAKTEPKDNDGTMNYSLEDHAEGIGMTGWDWVARASKWVGFDFDAIAGHADSHSKKLSDKDLGIIQEKACAIPWVTVRKSTSGSGLHLYVFLDVPTANHTEHAALARAVLGLMSAHVGYDFNVKVDAMGHIMWTWHRKMKGTDGLTLIKQGTKLVDIPPNWRDHISVIEGKRRKNLPKFVKDQILPTMGSEDEAVRSFEELCGQSTTVQLDAEHMKLIDFLSENKACFWWDNDHHMLVTHTYHLKQAHESLQLRGPFETIATGSEKGFDYNVFMFPMRRGAWVIRRYGPGVAEATTWEQDSSGYTRCFLNREPDLPVAARSQGATEHKSGGYVFQHADKAQAAATQLGASLPLPEWAQKRPAKLTSRKSDGKIVAEVRHDPQDNGGDMVPNGWYHEGKNWVKVLNAQTQSQVSTEIGNYDDLVRHVVTSTREDAGWVLRSDDQWSSEPMKHVTPALTSYGLNSKDAQLVIGSSVFKPWVLVNLPFQPEYPGDRTWNRNAAQFRYHPTNTDRLSYPHWNKLLAHSGAGLDDAILAHPWCKANGVATGADYLKIWIASLVQYPYKPLPYLFFYSEEQNTGKSTFHEALKLLFTRGVVRADAALTSEGAFNGELENAIMCIVEETDLRKQRSAYNRIKDWTTSPTLPIHRKNQTPYDIHNTTHWVQTGNKRQECPVEMGDSRITMIRVAPLDPSDLIPKDEFLTLLQKEGPDFTAAIRLLEVPPSRDRLNVPVVATDEKRSLEDASLTALQVFLREVCFEVPGAVLTVAEFYDRFCEWLDPSMITEWSKIKVGRDMPIKFPKGKLKRLKNAVCYGNISFDSSTEPKCRLMQSGEYLIEAMR